MKVQGLSFVVALAASVALAESITVGGGATVQLDAAKTIDSLTLDGTFAPDSAKWQCMVTNSDL